MSFPIITLGEGVYPGFATLYRLAGSIAKEKVLDPQKPGWKPMANCMPQVPNIWTWDSCFMTFCFGYANGELPVMNNLDNLYRLQREDGYISMAYRILDEEPAYGERINPPLFAWAERNYVRSTGDMSRIPETLPRIVRLFDWIQRNRRRDNGLYWFEDSGSTGMDNAPRSGYHAQFANGSDINHVDLISQQALSAREIAALARMIGEETTAQRFDEEYGALVGLLNRHHWNDRTQFYYDQFHNTHKDQRANHLNHRTAAAFWPLLAGACSAEQADCLIRVLVDPEEFWTEHPVSTLSKQDPNYDPHGRYWLGGVWAPINYMIACGLRQYGRFDIARRLAAAHIRGMARVMENPAYGTIWECYAPEVEAPATSGKGPGLVRPDFVGWSGLGPIAMLIEDVLGIERDVPAGVLTWRPPEEGHTEIRDLPFGRGRVALSSRREEGTLVLSAEATIALDLKIVLEGWETDEVRPIGPESPCLATLRKSTE